MVVTGPGTRVEATGRPKIWAVNVTKFRVVSQRESGDAGYGWCGQLSSRRNVIADALKIVKR